MFLSNKIVYGYAIALSFTFLGSMAGLLWGNSVHQEALQKSLAVSQEHRFLHELELNVLHNRPAEQLSPYLQDPVSFRRESSKFLDRMQRISILLETHKYPDKAPPLQGLETQLDEYEVFVKKYRQETQKLIDQIELLTASPKTLKEAEFQLSKLVKDQKFVQFIEFPERLAPFVRIIEQLEKEADAELIQAKVTRIIIYVTSLVLSAAIAAIFIIKMSLAIAHDQADANQKLQDQLIERQLSEVALQKSEAHQRALISAIPDILMRISRSGIYLEFVASPNFNVFGNLSNLVGKPLTEGLPTSAAEDRMKFIQLALQTNSIQIYEQDLSIDGKMQIEEVRIVPYGEDEVLALVRDITGRKQAELALAASEAQSRAILSVIPELMFRVGSDMVYREFITQPRDFDMAFPDINITGRSVFEMLLPADIANQHAHYLQKALQTGEVQAYDQKIQVGDRIQYEEVRVVKSGEDEVLFMIRDISDRKQAELALAASEAHSRAMLSAIPDLMFRVGADGVYRDFVTQNRDFAVDSLSPDRSGQSMADLLPEDIVERQLYYLQKAIETGELQVFEQQIQVGEKLVHTEVRVVKSGEDEVLFMIRNISDRKQAELALKQSELTNRVIVETMPDLLIQMDREGRYIQMSGGSNVLVKHLCNLSRDELDIYTVLSPEMAEQRLYYTNQAIESGSLQIYEQIIDVDGNLRHEEVRIAPLNDREVLIIIRDITDRKQAEQQLQQLNQVLETRVKERTLELQEREMQLMKLSERLALALKSGAIGCWEWDIEKNIVLWDDRMYELYGLKRDAESLLTYEIWANRLHPEDRAASELTTHQAILGLSEYDTEFRIVHSDGSIHFIKAYAMLVQDTDGKVQRMIGVNFDISDHKRAEAQLQKTNEDLMRATRLKDEFLANMSHELRTPLNAILGITEGLQDQVYGDLNGKQLKVLQTIERSGSHLLELINDILDLAKIEAGQIELDCYPTAINHLCQSSMAFIRQQAMQKRIHLDFKLCHNPPHLLVDERRIRQVLINLLNNAVKFTPEGGQVTLEVAPVAPVPVLDDRPPQQFLQISVSDTGIGISPENIKRLFQPFIQIDSALNRQYEGTGLGLALVKRIVELHGGIVGLTSELGVGSCFTISLPYSFTSELARDRNSANIHVSSPPSINATSPSPLILIAEDNESNVMTFTSYLEANGYRVLWAKNGQEAIAFTKSHRPNLILMDIQMPIMDGLEATEQIRRDSSLSNILIIALTALAKESDREKCLAAGVNAYLAKPVKLKELVTKIQILLERTANLYE